MACRQVGAKPLSNQMLGYCNKLQWNLKRNSYIFIEENALENVVWKMASICLGLNVLKANRYIDSSFELLMTQVHFNINMPSVANLN